MIGRFLGEFEIREPLGSGGMGEVYRAWDTKLDRDVAIKLLPEEFANSPERLGRFEREAKLLASLSHPNISGIYGIEEAGGKRFLSLEFVPGQSLADRIKSRRLRVPEVLEIMRQIADALEAAHHDGIIHRDLKPSNVMITPEGTAKVLDFGLGKASSVATAAETDPEAATETSGLTSSGLVVGTVPYMSPEQARGFAVDKRTDIWSFGCVLYEALTGRRAFEGETQSDTIVAILEREPDWRALPARTPGRIFDLLRRCLKKDPTRRLRHIGDAKLEIEEAAAEISGDSFDSQTVIAPMRLIDWRRAVPWLVAAAAVIVAATALYWDAIFPAGDLGDSRLFRETLAADVRLYVDEFSHPFAISPDGQHLAYAAHGGTAGSEIYLRDLSELESRRIPGTEGARSPFFSPDGRWVGFFSDGALRKVSIEGGPSTHLTETASFFGAAWLDNHTIVFSDVTRLLQIPDSGGQPRIVATTDFNRAEYFDSPVALPDSRAVLVTATTADEAEIQAVSLETGERKGLLEAVYPHVQYARSGHLVYGENGTVAAAPFDVETLEIAGPSAVVEEGVASFGESTPSIFALSASGTLVYVPERQAATRSRIVWMDRQGQVEPLIDDMRWYSSPRISPDGRSVAVTIVEHSRSYDVWIYDIAEGRFRRLTFAGNNEIPVWAPDGSRLAFLSFRDGLANLYSKGADGSGSAELLWGSPAPPQRAAGAGLFRYPSSWSPDGRYLAYFEASPDSEWDVSLLPMTGDEGPRPLLSTTASELGLRFSPDGRWIAYASDESSRYEIYVEPYPQTGGKWQISETGGFSPVWAPGGDELYFDNGRGQIMAVTIRTQPAFSSGPPRPLLDLSEIWSADEINAVTPGMSTRPVPEFDLSPDGERFLLIDEIEQEFTPWELVYVLDWLQKLRSELPARD
jgi:Tol biopolymer transport system component